ncbi:conserved hypothetical protein [Verrucomicrobia bacterium]|nr:conserved hypothetical protein [Verrucomicrobiota bacterium]
MSNKTRSKAGGFTLIEIMIVVAIIGMLAGIALPNYVRSRKVAQKTTCVANLGAIEGAIQDWALEERKAPDQPVEYRDIKPYLSKQVVCPSGGTCFDDSYQITSVDAPPACLRVPSGEFRAPEIDVSRKS